MLKFTVYIETHKSRQNENRAEAKGRKGGMHFYGVRTALE